MSSMWKAFPMPHEQLPPPLRDMIASYVLLEGVPDADVHLITACVVLTCLAFIQLRAFSRPPPLPLKRLPPRPALHIQFLPDDISSTINVTAAATTPAAAATTTTASTTAPSSFSAAGTPTNRQQQQQQSPWRTRLRQGLSTVSMTNMSRYIFRTSPSSGNYSPDFDEKQEARAGENGKGGYYGKDDENFINSRGDSTITSIDKEQNTPPLSTAGSSHSSSETERPFVHANDLPDSFAPLLSSSNVEMLTHQLTADLIHAVKVQGSVRLREGRHEIPLNKDSSRPQFLLTAPKGGCRLSAVAMIGSDGFSSEQDMDVSRATLSRSKPMVKHAGLVLDPPLALSNVAPTLIHFPTLFEDNFVPVLRQIQIIRLAVDFFISCSSFLEKLLWILESKCQIHLTKVGVVPVYKGLTSGDKLAPDWRLTLAFSGHALLFGFIPIPFINVRLPTFIIPQPHALLENLMTSQPLASAKLKREKINEEKIALAAFGAVEAWNADIKVVATPPAVGVDLTLTGGIAVALEIGLGRDSGVSKQATNEGGNRDPNSPAYNMNKQTPSSVFPSRPSNNSLSSWTTAPDQWTRGSGSFLPSVGTTATFDANLLVPWSLEFAAKGTISHDKMTVHVLKLAAIHADPFAINDKGPVMSKFSTRGSFAFWKANPDLAGTADTGPLPSKRRSVPTHRKTNSFGKAYTFGKTSSFVHPALATEDSPSVAAILMFPDETKSFHDQLCKLQYDYAFDVFEDTKLDAVTLSVGASHTMLNGGTMITLILDSMFAFGSLSAREDAILEANERERKRNILRHLPAIDFSFGIQNIYIPPESSSYSDDGQTLFLPEVAGGRVMARCLGGIDVSEESSMSSSIAPGNFVDDGIKLIADFEVGSLTMRTEGDLKEYPELEIFDGIKLRTLLSGIIGGSLKAHFRPQTLPSSMNSTGPNIYNPLEAYEIDFSESSASLKIMEYSAAFGHRRIIFPAESTFVIKVIESIVDMSFEGNTSCELGWDFQGLSPILQVTTIGQSPENCAPENKEQVALLITPLRQGRISFQINQVGGIKITKGETSRDHKKGLFDWKFFNALVSPDGGSGGRIFAVVQDKRTMNKLLQVVKIINEDLHRILSYAIKQVWRAKEIFDQEGVHEAADVIPASRMARILSLFITGDVKQSDETLSIVERVVSGDGLDVVKLKDLLRNNLENYDDWAPEIDRAVRWAEVALGPTFAAHPYVEDGVIPLVEMTSYAVKFGEIPSASQLYESVLEKKQMPLDPAFSNLVSRVAPYLSFRQIEFFLQARAPTHWQPSDLRRIRYVYAIKKKVLEIAESYGGLSFLPQSFLVSVFLGEATRTGMRVSQTQSKKTKSQLRPSIDASIGRSSPRRQPTLSRLRRRRSSHLENLLESPEEDDYFLTPAARVASRTSFLEDQQSQIRENFIVELESKTGTAKETYELGDTLLGPQDVAILLQAGLTSVMKSSSVVQLNQRMLLDLICSQPRSFAIAVLAEIGMPSGQGSPRGLTSALMSLLEIDQTAFKPSHQINMHTLLESWLPGLKIPRRDDYMAGGRWARQSFYEALFSVATSIMQDAESYWAVKGHLQRVRQHTEKDPLPQPIGEQDDDIGLDFSPPSLESNIGLDTKLKAAIDIAKSCIASADEAGEAVLKTLIEDDTFAKESDKCKRAVCLYRKAFEACANVLAMDKHAFQTGWFRCFYQRNYDALMIKSVYDNVVENVDNCRHW